MKKQITILGAGLAGCLAAVYLARRGFSVRILERRGDLRVKQQTAGRSINLALANRGIRALREVGLYKDIQRLTIPMRGRMLHEPGREATLAPYGKDESEVIYSISRDSLTALLLDRAEQENVELIFNRRVDAIDVNTGLLRLRDEDGNRETIQAAPIIAADGSSSAARRAMADCPGCGPTERYSPHAYKELTIPATAGGGFAIEKNALHIWPRGGFMMIALPNLDGSFTVTLFLSRSGANSFDTIADATQLNAFFDEHFADARALIPDLQRDFFANPTGRMVTVRCDSWYHKDRVLLIGDAAHAIVPFHGQGMNCAFEDCYELDQCFAECGDDFEQVFALFEERRKPNANAIADMAIENYTEMSSSVRDPRFHLKKTLAFELERRWPDKFVPRYSLVMFHHVPYALAQQRGIIQQEILDELIGPPGAERPLEQIDYDTAGRLIETKL